MRHVLELLDGDVARVYSDLGIDGYRPKFSPVIRAIVAAAELEAELPAVLTEVLFAAERRVADRPMRARISDAGQALRGTGAADDEALAAIAGADSAGDGA